MTLYMNKNGGFYRSDDKVTELKTIESDAWPMLKTVPVKIVQWKGGSHFYLVAVSSWKDNFIDPNIKYDTFEEAQKNALKYTSGENIIFEEDKNYFYKTIGD
jgi:hypothetical protein